MSEPDRGTTERGFITYDEFTDAYGATVVIRESSAARAPHVWLSADGGTTGGVGSQNHGSAHLTVDQAVRVRDALNAFIEGHT